MNKKETTYTLVLCAWYIVFYNYRGFTPLTVEEYNLLTNSEKAGFLTLIDALEAKLKNKSKNEALWN